LLRIAQKRRDALPQQQMTSDQAFRDNPEMGQKFLDMAIKEASASENPAAMQNVGKRARELYDQLYGAGGQAAPAAQGQMPGAPPVVPPVAPAAAQPAAPDYSLFDKPGPAVDWKKMQASSPADEERMSNLQQHFTGLPPQAQNAVGYAIQPGVDPQGKMMANAYLRENGFDLNLMGKVPQAPRLDWLSVMNGQSAEERPQITAIRKFSETQPPDIQNAIGLVMNPKSSPEAKKNATAHLMNRGVNLLEIQ
jgi:hypothetical protein